MGWGGRHSWTRPAAARVRNPERASLGEHCVGGLCAEWSSLLKAGELGFSSCIEEGAMSSGCTVPAEGEGVPASPGDSVSEGVCWVGSIFSLTSVGSSC